MKAIIVDQPGGPEVLKIRDIPTPSPHSGWVLIQIKAFGLNRSEMFTRQGHSGDAVQFPRVLGIECVGVVVEAPDTSFEAGQTVVTMMGGLGREFDGGYAEYTLAPASQVIPLNTTLSWEKLAAIPETFITAWGSLVEAMEMQAGQTLLVRGGTSSVGMSATTIAKQMGLTVLATTRNEAKRDALLANGVDEVVIDNGQIAEQVRQLTDGGVNGVLELIGTTTLRDSLQATAPKGIVCFTGILGNSWILPDFYPFMDIPHTVKLTVFTSETVNAANATAPLQKVVELAEAGHYNLNIDRIFQFDEIVEAHTYMESNKARGKLVVVVG